MKEVEKIDEERRKQPDMRLSQSHPLNLIIMIGMRFSQSPRRYCSSPVRSRSATSRHCACDISNPETLGARECGLCKEAETQPPDVAVFFLKDNNPRKPNRWLALPRFHGKGGHAFCGHDRGPAHAALDRRDRQRPKKFGAISGASPTTAISAAPSATPTCTSASCSKVSRPKISSSSTDRRRSRCPRTEPGYGFIPFQGGKLHVHLSEQICETVLLR